MRLNILPLFWRWILQPVLIKSGLIYAIGVFLLVFSVALRTKAAIQCGNPDLPPDCGLRVYCSPIIIDFGGQGFKLTSAADGVMFDIAGTNHPVQIAWTAPGSQNAFLAIDWNHNGKIDSGRELFGNFSPQPQSSTPNGFVALADLDSPPFGGNGNGVVDKGDAMFSSLLLWVDINHDGISQPNELFTLPQLGVDAISLSYTESRRVDAFGNQFRFKAAVYSTNEPASGHVGHTAYDVLLTGVQQ